MNAIYAIYFTGATGSGHGLILLREGTIVGADAAGATYDGSYETSAQGDMLQGSVRLTIPPGGTLVTGATAGSEPLSIDIPLVLPANLGGGHPLALQTPTGPVNVIFKKLRDVE